MNLILLKPDDFTDSDRVCLTGRHYDHIKHVLRAGPGDPVACGVLDGNMGSGIIASMDAARVTMTVTLNQEPPPPLPLHLVLGLPRPKMLKRIIQNVTTLGVKQIYLVNSWRVEKSFWHSPVLTDEKLENYKILGLEQAKDTRMPVIHKKRFFSRFVKNELPDLAKNTRCITAHPKADRICPARMNQPLTLAVGPEGGWIDREVKTLADMGFVTYSTGPRILTVETAVTCLISRLFS
ncbi:MAG: 16S rRNA (uracil(1498)-N(3))-methyltransferase [Desulfotignum sp.]|nr:16S rRNA (uracil(1498)-N(3))-methyltransferase [Desulfotignum sp.]MCF8113202.1 16S rRNA (uracil(1498)-N(3))-methyltransferase [Desulfotignum sp.]MCF8125450.1 16S rRNA (uracil(1498)-N(3))-methyltransferase [Desulfotignum sp.]